jgi:hypothetical protein
MEYKIGDIVCLERYNPLMGSLGSPSRAAKVIEINERFIVCQSIRYGYKECLSYHETTQHRGLFSKHKNDQRQVVCRLP